MIYMDEAYKEALKAYRLGEVPVGAVITKNDKIISKGHNKVELYQDPTQHAEIVAIKEAARVLGDWRLDGCTLYVTMEPCAMCAGAIVQSRIKTLIYALDNTQEGAVARGVHVIEGYPLHRVIVHKVKHFEAEKLTNDFFEKSRRK